MFIRWNNDDNNVVGIPRTTDDGSGDYFPLVIQGKIENSHQTISYHLQDGVVFGTISGPTDRSEFPASVSEMKLARRRIFDLPIRVSIGLVFQFDAESKLMMESSIALLSGRKSLTMQWRLLDNSSITVNGLSLSAYYEELCMLQGERCFQAHEEYLAFRESGATNKQIEDWVLSHTH